MEKTLIILKPDAVDRGLIGQILARFEGADLRIERLDVRVTDRETVSKHYPDTNEWLGGVGGKTLTDYEAQHLDPVQLLGTNDAVEIGRLVKGWLVDFMVSGPVVLGVLSGNRAVEAVRKLVGSTLPITAAPGTIRGDYATDSPDAANAESRPIRNLIHASGTVDEATSEIALWFRP